jgi:cell division protein FtsI/penicillin-binding protein 2
MFIQSLAIAGKTGTAETGADRPSHAWFAGYAPADDPKLAIVVVLEHAGDGAAAAGPVAKRLVVRMEQLGLL